MQVPWIATEHQEISSAPVRILGGSAGEQTADVERGITPEEWKITAGSIGTVRNPYPCADGPGAPTEDNIGFGEDLS